MHEDQRQEDETAPFLPDQPALAISPPTRNPQISVALVAFCFFCLAAASAMIDVPIIRLVEDNLCRRYFDDLDWDKSAIDEKRCKTDHIQSELAYLTGMVYLVQAVIGLVTAFPFGVLADIIGRKRMIFICNAGSLLQLAWTAFVLGCPNVLPVQFILAGPLFTILGGGNTVLVANLFSIVSDLATETDRASAFSSLACASLFGASVGPAISSKVMEATSPWGPVVAAFFVILVGVSALALVPETHVPSNSESARGQEQGSSFKIHLSRSLHLLKASMAILQSPSMIIILATFLTVIPEVLGFTKIFPQYVSKHFGWPLARTGYLLTIRGIVQMVLLLVLLPLLSKLLLRRQSAPAKDLTLARASVVLAAAGSLLMAIPNLGVAVFGLALQTFGAAQPPLCRALATTYIRPEDASKLNTLIGIVEGTGSLVAGPALAWLFSTGVKLKGAWIGLPFLGLAASFVLCLVGLGFVTIPRRDCENDYNEEEDMQ